MPVSDETRGEGVDGVAKPALLAHLLEEARGHAPAKRTGADLRGEIVGVPVRRRLEGEHYMGLLEGLLAAPHAAAIARAPAQGHCLS